MAPSEHAPSAVDPSVAPAGTQGLAVHSDLRCPWARIAVHRLLGAAERRGIGGELVIDHRWFPLGDEAAPGDPSELDRRLAAIGPIEPDLAWATWAELDHPFPTSSRLASAWVQAAKAAGPDASAALDRALREALFADGADIADPQVLEQVAGDVAGLDLDELRAELDSGRPDAELDRHAEAAERDEIPASPTIVAADGTIWTNPGIEHGTDDDGLPRVESDDPTAYDDIVDAFIAAKHYD